MLWAVLMAGGSGTRFWPESRGAKPKQFLKLFGPKTLLEQTAARLHPVVPPSRIWVITQADKVSLAAKLLAKVPRSQIVGEPAGRNTAPCAALAAALIHEKDPHAVIALLPADHAVEKTALFRKTLLAAALAAEKYKLPVTFAVKPSCPHTGYGYLERGPHVILRPLGRKMMKVYYVRRFHEKPTLSKARLYLRSKRFFWNSGMFVWRTDALLEAARRHLPRVDRLARQIAQGGGNWQGRMKRLYPSMPGVSIDFGFMEKMRGKILMIPVAMGWKDVGGWHSLPEILPQDTCKNVVLGKTLLVDSTGNVVKARHRLVALLGVDNHVVIDTEDALLICPKHKTEAIRKIVEKLKENKWGEYL